MCYRPATAAKANKCPNCGALNPPIAKTCIKCKVSLTEAEAEVKPKTEEDKQE